MEGLKSGDIIGGCVLESIIAEGGMGAVYKARRQRDNATVAVKVLRRELGEHAEGVARFLREGLLSSSLNHPAVIRVYSTDKEKDHYYMVMEYLIGMDLMKVVRADGPMAAHVALRLIRAAAEALAYAHERGIFHRDIKPGNLILTTDGDLKITDFGIACLKDQDSLFTREGEVVGTPAYMSPEQCRGDPIDGRSDLYSLGATLYTLLCGRQPFKGGGAKLVHQIVNDRPRSLRAMMPDLPENCVRLVQRMMAKHPAARYQSGKEVVEAIDEVLEGKRAPEAETIEPPEDETTGPTWLLVACKATIIVVVAAGLIMAWPFLYHSWLSFASGLQEDGDGKETPVAGKTPPRVIFQAGVDEPDPELPVTDLPPERFPQSRLLARQVTEFQEFLVEGRVKEALAYLRPSARANPNALSCLWGISNVVQTIKLGTRQQALVRSFGQDQVLVKLSFANPALPEFTAQFEFRWVFLRGVWMVDLLSR